MESRRNMVGWFEIPVTDMTRAIKFYETFLNIKISRQQFGPLEMGLFPGNPDSPGSSGSLSHFPDMYKPAQEGVLVYFSSRTGDLNDELSRVEKAGGRVLMEKKEISEENGFMALLLDTEGNRVAIHSRS